MQIKKSTTNRLRWETDEGEPINLALKKINKRLAGYDRLLTERNKLDVHCQIQAITIAKLNSQLVKCKSGII